MITPSRDINKLRALKSDAAHRMSQSSAGMLAPTSGGASGTGLRSGPRSLGDESGLDFTPPPISTTSILCDGALHKESSAARRQTRQLLPRVGIGIPKTRVRFLRF